MQWVVFGRLQSLSAYTQREKRCFHYFSSPKTHNHAHTPNTQVLISIEGYFSKIDWAFSTLGLYTTASRSSRLSPSVSWTPASPDPSADAIVKSLNYAIWSVKKKKKQYFFSKVSD